jgi:DNA-binding CsgD family transcriptional regulator/PAS domain-containing protein
MNQDELLALIDQIYEAAADAGRWPVVLQTIADAFGAGEASLSAVSPRAVPWLVAPRTDPAYLQSYGEHYHPLNLFWQRMTRVPVGTAVTDRMVLPKATLRSSPFFNEWSRPQGYLSVMGATLLVEDEWRVEFVVPGKNEFGPEQLKLYDAIAPHLKRAVQLNRRLQAAAIDRTYSHAALHSLGQGVLIVDRDAQVLFANRAADGAFNDGLRIADGVLCGGSPSETASLHFAIAAGTHDSLNDGRDTIAISRGPYRMPLSLLVIPLRTEIDWIASHQQAAAVFVTDPDSATGPGSRQLQQRFGLTPAEATLVVEMLKGSSIQAVADRLGIKIATARTHIHRVLAKTGARSQADLMRLLLTSGHGVRRNGSGE